MTLALKILKIIPDPMIQCRPRRPSTIGFLALAILPGEQSEVIISKLLSLQR